MRRRLQLLITLSIFAVLTYAQNISGTWEGNYGRTLFTDQPRKLVVELSLFNDSLITGASHLFYRNNKYEHYKINGVFHIKDSTIKFSEDSIISINLSPIEDNCMGNYKMKLKISDSLLIFEGQWMDISRKLFHCPTSTVWLNKKREDVPLSKTQMDSSVIKIDKNLERISDIQSLIQIDDFEKDSIKLDVYDNGIIDNDSVSIYLDNKLLVSKKRIESTPFTIYISLTTDNPIKKIQLAAESLGTIPPCTAIMIVTTKKKRYELNLSSSFSKNATVELFLKE